MAAPPPQPDSPPGPDADAEEQYEDEQGVPPGHPDRVLFSVPDPYKGDGFWIDFNLGLLARWAPDVQGGNDEAVQNGVEILKDKLSKFSAEQLEKLWPQVARGLQPSLSSCSLRRSPRRRPLTSALRRPLTVRA